MLADKAPRTNYIGDDVDANRLSIGHGWLPLTGSLGRALLRHNHAAAGYAQHQGVERVGGLQRCQRDVGPRGLTGAARRQHVAIQSTGNASNNDMRVTQSGLRWSSADNAVYTPTTSI